MNKKRIYLGTIIITLLLVGSADAASNTTQSQSRSGTTQNSTNKTQTATATTNRTTSKEKFTADKCATIQDRLTIKINGYNRTNNRNYNAFLNLQARLKKVESRLSSEESLDTTTLKEHMVKLDEYIKTYAEDYALLNSELKFAHKKTCDSTQAEFQTQLTTAKEQVTKVHEDRDKIREYYANFIKPDLIALKKQMNDEEENSGTEEGEDSETIDNNTASSAVNNQ